MSLSDPLVLKDSAGTDVSFGIQSTIAARNAGDPSGTIRVDSTSSATEPRLLTVKQQVTGKGTSRVRRTLVSLTQERISAAGLSSKLVVNLSWVFPLNGDHSDTNLKDGVAVIGDLVGGTVTVDSAKIAALLQGQS